MAYFPKKAFTQHIVSEEIPEDLPLKFEKILGSLTGFEHTISHKYGSTAWQLVNRVQEVWKIKKMDIKTRWSHGYVKASMPISSSNERHMTTLSATERNRYTQKYFNLDANEFVRKWVLILDLLIVYQESIHMYDVSTVSFIESWPYNRQNIYAAWELVFAPPNQPNTNVISNLHVRVNSANTPRSSSRDTTYRQTQADTTLDQLFNPPVRSAPCGYRNVSNTSGEKTVSPSRAETGFGTSARKYEDQERGTYDSKNYREVADVEPMEIKQRPIDDGKEKYDKDTVDKLIRTYKQQNDVLEKSNALLTAARTQLIQEKTEITTERDEFKDLFTRSKEKCKSLECKNEALTRDLESLKGNTPKIKEILKGKDKTIEELTYEIRSLQQTSARNSMRELDQKDSEIDGLNKKIRDLELAIRDKQRTIDSERLRQEEQQTELSHLRNEKASLMDQLSATMNRQMSRDETDLENINIRNRPMKIMEEYELFCSQQWLDAKMVLDDNAELANARDPLSEGERCSLLCTVLMKTYGKAEKLLKRHKESLKTFVDRLATDPLSVQKGDQPRSSRDAVVSLDKDLEVSFAKTLKQFSDKADFSQMTQTLLKEVFDETVTSGKLTRSIGRAEPLQSYITKALSLGWRMVIQQPPMAFDSASLLGKFGPISDQVADPHFGSADPRKTSAYVQYYVYPAILHGGNQMKKARVFLAEEVKKPEVREVQVQRTTYPYSSRSSSYA